MAELNQNCINLHVTRTATGGVIAIGTSTPASIYIQAKSYVNQDLRTTANVKHASLRLTAGATINEFSTATALGTSTVKSPVENAVKKYVDNAVSAVTGLTYVEKATDFTATIGKGYFLNKAVGTLNVTLPAAFDVGDPIDLVGKGAGKWKAISAAGDNIQFGSVTTKQAGYIRALDQNDCVYLIGQAASTTWEVKAAVGNIAMEIS